MIILIDREGESLQALHHFFGDQLVHFTEPNSALSYASNREGLVSMMLYVYNRETSDYFYAEASSVRDAGNYQYPIGVIYSDHDSLSTASLQGYDDAIHCDVLPTLGVRKLKASLEWRAAHNELTQLKLNKDYYNERDELTGLPNLRKMIDLTDDYLRYCHRKTQAASFMSIEIKLVEPNVEDELSTESSITQHDRSVLSVVSSLQELLYRSIDILGRVDDLHFFIILPDTDKAGLKVVQDRMNELMSTRASSTFLSYTFKVKTFEFNDWHEDVDLQQSLLSIVTDFNL